MTAKTRLRTVTSRTVTGGIAVAATLLAAACGQIGPDPSAPDSGSAVGVQPTEDEAEFADELEQAIADASAHFDVDPSDIEVREVRAVTWPDGAIGCPQPGEVYTQALVEGYRILLGIDGQSISYHGELSGDPERCDEPSEPVDD